MMLIRIDGKTELRGDGGWLENEQNNRIKHRQKSLKSEMDKKIKKIKKHGKMVGNDRN